MIDETKSKTDSAPLLVGKLKGDVEKDVPVELPDVRVAPYDEKEETTCVDSATLLTESAVKQWLLVPLISLLSLLVFPVFLYWKKPMQRDWLYVRATSLQTATHIYIEGRGKLATPTPNVTLMLDDRRKQGNSTS